MDIKNSAVSCFEAVETHAWEIPATKVLKNVNLGMDFLASVKKDLLQSEL